MLVRTWVSAIIIGHVSSIFFLRLIFRNLPCFHKNLNTVKVFLLLFSSLMSCNSYISFGGCTFVKYYCTFYYLNYDEAVRGKVPSVLFSNVL